MGTLAAPTVRCARRAAVDRLVCRSKLAVSWFRSQLKQMSRVPVSFPRQFPAVEHATLFKNAVHWATKDSRSCKSQGPACST